MILQWLASPEWAQVVKALLHTLWQAAIVAAVLGLALRRLDRPGTRYRCSLAALAVVLAAGLFSWAVLNRPTGGSKPLAAPVSNNSLSKPMEVGSLGEPAVVVRVTATPMKPAPPRWTAWLALVWLAGAGLMLARAGAQVAGAERLRRSCRPLADPRVAELVAEARRAIGLARQLRVVATDRLTSPAVVGVLVPTLILPLSLVTVLTPEQIRFVLLHELAHIRRGDYLANLFQLFAEALLFFNPAVWWISHQVRREREACCDALAIELSGAPADYARTLVHVAERILNPPPAAAPAFGNKRPPSSLADRVQRLLVPGYRPALRLTWRAMLASLMLGGVLLVLSAVGTRVTVAAAAKLLTPQERVERIEKKMTEYGQRPESLDSENNERAVKTEIAGRVRMADGSSVSGRNRVCFMESTRSGSGVYPVKLENDGSFQFSVRRGKLWLVFEDDSDCAPAALGPIDTTVTNRIENLDFVVDRGFNVTVEVVDADTGAPVSGAKLATRFEPRGTGSTNFRKRDWTTDGNGRVRLDHCADLPLGLTLNAADYVIVEEKFDSLKPEQTLRIAARRGVPLTGAVVDKATGQPLAGATLHLLYEQGPAGQWAIGGHEVWDDPQRLLGTTDAAGRFVVKRLRNDTRYSIGVAAPGRESVRLKGVFAGQTNHLVRLGPELVVQCRLTGNLALLKKRSIRSRDVAPYVQVIFDNSLGENRTSFGILFDVTVRDGAGQLRFTNWVAGPVTVEAAGRRFERNVDAPLDDWVIDLGQAERAREPLPRREMLFRFKHPSGVLPRGTIYVSLTEDSDGEPASRRKECEIQNGEVRVTALVGTHVSWEPARTVGYWFKEDSLREVPPGADPLVVTISAVPAGAIYARARNADGTPAANLSFSVIELQRSPLRGENTFLSTSGDSFAMDDVPRKWVSNPLPLGGTYQIIGSRGNSFCASQPIKLTEDKPDAELELQFPAGRAIEGRLLDAAGRPVRHVDLTGSFSMSNHSFGLKAAFTDEDGRFRFEAATPGVGTYTLNVESPGCRAEIIPVDFGKLPLTIRLKPGLKLAGQVVEAGAGRGVPNAKINAYVFDADGSLGRLPSQTAQTDAEGRFEFNTLSEASYTLYVHGAEIRKPRQAKFKAGQAGALRLEVRFEPGSSLAPKAPNTSSSRGDEAPISGSFAGAQNGSRKSSSVSGIVRPPTDPVQPTDTAPPGTSGSRLQSAPGISNEAADLLMNEQLPEGRVINSIPGYVLYVGRNRNQELQDVRVYTLTNGNVEKSIYAPRGRIESNADKQKLTLHLFDVRSVYLQSGIPATASGELTLSLDLSKPKIRAGEPKNSDLPQLREELRDLESRIQPPIQSDQPAAAAPPQINIKVKFVEVPEPFMTGFGATNGLTGNATTQSLTGILTAPQFKTFFSLLEQQHDVQVVSEGQITILSGRRGQIQMLDPYPSLIATNINPQALQPPGVRSGDTNGLYQMDRFSIGPLFDVTPSVGPDGATVDMEMIVSVIEFLGYEPATNSVEAYVDGRKQTVSLPLPQLKQRQTTSKAIVWDGQTVVLGGAPIAALASAEKTGSPQESNFKKKQLLVFITPTIIDPAGNRIHSEGELPAAQKGIPPQSSSFAPAAEGAGIFPGQAPNDRTTSRRAPDSLRQVPDTNSAGLQSRTNLIQTSRGRQEILAKLNQIRLDSVFFNGIPLGEVLRNLNEEIKKRDPEKRGVNFLIDSNLEVAPGPAALDPVTGLPVAPDLSPATNTDLSQTWIATNPPLREIRLADALDAIVILADRPIKYTIQDYGIVFSLKATNEPPTLHIRKFKVDPNTFLEALQKVSGTNFEPAPAPAIPLVAADKMAAPWVFQSGRINADAVQSAWLKYFDSLGVDLRPETGKSVFFSDSRGDLVVRATAQDLDIIENALDALNMPPPQVNIKGTFVEVSRQGFEQLLRSLNLTNASGNSSTQQFTAMLTAEQSRAALSELGRRNDAKVINVGQVTTLTGRQCQIQAVDLRPVVFANTNGVMQTNRVPLGPALDVIPYVLADDRAVALTVMPSVTDFLGYDDPGPMIIELQGGSNATAGLPPPKIRTRQAGKNGIAAPFPAPRFRVRQMYSSTNLLDGETLVLASSAANEVTCNEPVLRFRGGRVVTQTNYLIVFVTPTLIDPTGNRIHPDE